MSYHEQLVHLPLALNVGLIVCKHLKPGTKAESGWGLPLGQDRHLPMSKQGCPLRRDASQASPVVVHEHVHHVPEAAGVPRGEEAAADLVDGLAQLGQALVVLPGIVPGPSRHSLWALLLLQEGRQGCATAPEGGALLPGLCPSQHPAPGWTSSSVSNTLCCAPLTATVLWAS